ncbi:MAG: cytochrome c family protein [Bacteroidales bacterium]|nr:cytochrome c family protein [Bacteroidales bacterium]MCF8392013.1 cytochrome c family protein [Bacteroidales bacterium]
MKKLKLISLLLTVFMFTTLSAQEFKYIGAEKCKMCHNKPEKGEQFNKWSAGPHANAMKSLKGAEAQDPKCLKCHSTAGHVDAKAIATLTVAEGVSCETCHGPGSRYKAIPIMKNQAQSIANGLIIPDEKLCRTCHNEESPDFKGFDYAKYSAKIAHPNPLAAK